MNPRDLDLCADCNITRQAHAEYMREMECDGFNEPSKPPVESEHTRLVAGIRTVIMARRDPCYGALQVTDQQADELARAIATRLIIGWKMFETEED